MSDDDKLTLDPHTEDTARILQRRRELKARSLGRWRKLLLAGAATGMAFGTLTCRAQVCLSQVLQLECSTDSVHPSLQNMAEVSAQWVETSPGTFVIVVTAEIGQDWPQGIERLTFTGTPQLVDATMVDGSMQDYTQTFECTPTPGVFLVEVVLPLDCDGYANAIHVLLDTSSDPADGAFVPVTWVD